MNREGVGRLVMRKKPFRYLTERLLKYSSE